jgi:hypothetical protein
MPKSTANVHLPCPADRRERELLDFYDDLTATSAAAAFLMQSLATSMRSGEVSDPRTATGATFCVEWVNGRLRELDERLRAIRARGGSLGN